MKRNAKICCIFNYAPHYRLPIYKLIDSELGADFYFGNKLPDNQDLKKLDYSELAGYKKEISSHFSKRFEYTTGWLRLALDRRYDRYLITPNCFAINQWLFLLLCKLTGKQVYLWAHGLTGEVTPRTLTLFKIYSRFIKASFIYGQHAIDNMAKLGFNSKKMSVIHNSLDHDKHIAIRQSLKKSDIYKDHFGNDNPNIVFIGRLTSVKSLDAILDAQALLRERGVEFNSIFIGYGPELERLKGKAESEKLPTWFYGESYDEGTNAQMLYDADICVSPGNVGLTAIHSLTFGTPVITNDDFGSQMPEFEAIIPGKTGDFFKNGSVEDLANKIEQWLSNHSEEREAIRKECFAEIDSNWTPEYQIRLFTNILI